jgi:type VI secretion system protein ImpK
MVDVGVGRLTASGRGDTEPIADNATPQGRQHNRRIEFVIVTS